MAFARWRSKQLTCFYCGARSSQQWKGGRQQWRCAACDATNHLDNHGQITDPPAQSTPEPSRLVRYARSVSPPVPNHSTSSDIFCSTCLKNQHLLKETLSAYLPPEDSPDFPDYAAAYESYREELERRYPQVCSRCAPRVRDQIRKATYAAKADHLRRMMDRTKRTGLSDEGYGRSKALLVILSGILSRTSSLLEVMWHALVALSLSKATHRTPAFGEDDSISGNTFLAGNLSLNAYRDQIVALYHSYNFTSWIPMSLLVAFLTIWWHPAILKRQRNPRARLKGLSEFYFLQVVILLIRTISFLFLRPAVADLSNEMLRGAHIFLSVIIFSGIVISPNTIQLDLQPRFTFPTQEDLILPDVPQPTSEDYHLPYEQTPRSNSGISTFPISQLASVHGNVAQVNHPSTPPPENGSDPDSMDWSPSVNPAQSFHPNPRAQPGPPPSQGPSPFHGTLPAAPLPPNHKLRNPNAHRAGKFRKATEQQQSNFFTRISSQPRRSSRLAKNTNTETDLHDSDESRMTSDEDGTADTASIASSAIFAGSRKKKDLNMANPKFFAPEDQRDTGLEDLFSSSFGLQDTPKVVSSQARHSQSSTATPRAQKLKARPSQKTEERWGGFGEIMQKHETPDVSIEDPAGGRRRLLSMAAPAAALAVGLSVWGAVS